MSIACTEMRRVLVEATGAGFPKVSIKPKSRKHSSGAAIDMTNAQRWAANQTSA